MATHSDRPNIVLILSDQHNASIMGAAGDPLVRTPAMDDLAARGVRLANCYCPSPLCVPSRSALLTGVLPDRTEVFTNHHALPSHWPTLMHSLVNTGYHTTLIGRMHFMGPDQRHGYLERIGADMCPTEIGAPFGNLGELQPAYGQSRTAVERSGPGFSTTMRYDETVTTLAESYLENYGAAPLFLTVGLYAPHNPYVCPTDLYHHYRSGVELPPGRTDQRRSRSAEIHPAAARWYDNRDSVHLNRESILRARAGYYGMVEELDSRVGRLVAATRRRFGNDAVIVYASDHGDMAGHLGMFWKSSMYDGSVRVPVVINGGRRHGAVEAPRSPHVVDEPTSLLDLTATLLALAGAEPLPVSDGIDLFESGIVDDPAERAIVSMLGDLKGDAPSAMIRRGRYKLVDHAGYDEAQLFDLEEDPGELVDRGVDPAYADIRVSLRADLYRRWNPKRTREIVEWSGRNLKVFRAYQERVRPPMPEYHEPSGSDNRLESR